MVELLSEDNSDIQQTSTKPAYACTFCLLLHIAMAGTGDRLIKATTTLRPLLQGLTKADLVDCVTGCHKHLMRPQHRTKPLIASWASWAGSWSSTT
jgi:hypothetical protein